MEMKNRLLFVPVLVALVVSLAACGGGSQIPAGAIAVVNGPSGQSVITTGQFNDFFAQGLTAAKLQGQDVTPGSAGYTAVRNQTVGELVELAEVKQQMKKENVTVTGGDIDKFIANLVKQSYKGSEAKFLAALKKSQLTMKQAREQVFINLLAQRIQTNVQSSAKVTPAEERAYYQANLTQFQKAAATTRPVQYILFRCAPTGSVTCPASVSKAKKKLADKVEQKLQNGASFAAMAKQYSDDSTTAPLGGKFTLTKGGVVPAFGKVGFALKNGETSQPVDATSTANQGFGWFIIKALGSAKATKAHTESFADAKATIYQTLLQQNQQTLWQQWLTDLQNEYKGKVSYGAGYAPPTTTAGATVAPPATTG
jgi:foldase protein PrsA